MITQRITVQVLNLCTGEVREVVANIRDISEQAAVDKLYAIAKDEMAYRYLGAHGVLDPSDPAIPAFTTKYAPGNWWARS